MQAQEVFKRIWNTFWVESDEEADNAPRTKRIQSKKPSPSVTAEEPLLSDPPSASLIVPYDEMIKDGAETLARNYEQLKRSSSVALCHELSFFYETSKSCFEIICSEDGKIVINELCAQNPALNDFVDFCTALKKTGKSLATLRPFMDKKEKRATTKLEDTINWCSYFIFRANIAKNNASMSLVKVILKPD